jgi:hypothetical protein
VLVELTAELLKVRAVATVFLVLSSQLVVELLVSELAGLLVVQAVAAVMVVRGQQEQPIKAVQVVAPALI